MPGVVNLPQGTWWTPDDDGIDRLNGRAAADGWTRPLGTSVATGPGHELWTMMSEFDIKNGIGADTGLDHLLHRLRIDDVQITVLIRLGVQQRLQHDSAVARRP